MRKIGLLGGTFDPPHLGHLIIAEEVRLAQDLDEIWFIPSQEPPHKRKALSEAVNRARMVERAISTNPFFKLSTVEIDRSGKSYTADTLQQLKSDHPEAAFSFIIGADMVEYLPKWRDIDKLTKMVTFIGVKRKNYELKSEYPVTYVDIPMIEISSTMIRQRLGSGASVKYLVPEPVETYIKENGLYE